MPGAEQRAATPQKPAGERISVAEHIRRIMPSSTPTGLSFLRESLGLKVPTLSFGSKKKEETSTPASPTTENDDKPTAPKKGEHVSSKTPKFTPDEKKLFEEDYGIRYDKKGRRI